MKVSKLLENFFTDFHRATGLELTEIAFPKNIQRRITEQLYKDLQDTHLYLKRETLHSAQTYRHCYYLGVKINEIAQMPENLEEKMKELNPVPENYDENNLGYDVENYEYESFNYGFKECFKLMSSELEKYKEVLDRLQEFIINSNQANSEDQEDDK